MHVTLARRHTCGFDEVDDVACGAADVDDLACGHVGVVLILHIDTFRGKAGVFILFPTLSGFVLVQFMMSPALDRNIRWSVELPGLHNTVDTVPADWNEMPDWLVLLSK